jgi:hypothetical protein
MACYVSPEDYRDRIGYLTVHESDVAAGAMQHRAGSHIERPLGPLGPLGAGPLGELAPGGGGGYVNRTYNTQWALGRFQRAAYFPNCPCWGLGYFDESRGVPIDGIYMASAFYGAMCETEGTCAVWPATIDHPEKVTDGHGGIEHLREYLPNDRKYVMKNGELVWMTDRTPHESLPAVRSGRRQFFRVVAGPISVWYSRHNTPNPLGVAPGAPISDKDKFVPL